MSRLTRLSARLVQVQARIAEIEASYPTLTKYKGYSKGFGELSATYQDFGAVGREYRELLAQEDAIEDQIDNLTGTETGSAVATFYTQP
jgi:hypothetical protein